VIQWQKGKYNSDNKLLSMFSYPEENSSPPGKVRIFFLIFSKKLQNKIVLQVSELKIIRMKVHK